MDRKNPTKSAASDYSFMMDMFKQAKEEYEMYKDLLIQGLDADDISFARADFLFKSYTKEDIENLNFELAYEMLTKIRKPENPNSKKERIPDNEWVEDLCFSAWGASHDVTDKEQGYDYETMKEELVIKNLVRLKTDIDELEKSKKEVEKLQEKVDDVTNEYQNFMCSEEYDNAQRNKIEKLRVQLDEQKKKNNKTFSERQENRIIEKKIKELESILDNSYILTRFEKMGEKEVQNIVSTYFDSKRSTYIIDKFKTKIVTIGFKPEIYRFFFNIEENYLDEEYHVYNNLFLFIAMRFIGYSNLSSSAEKAYCRDLISSLSKLIYEKYSDVQKEKFLSVIKRILDNFKPYYDKFDKENIVHPKHPRRIQKNKEQLEEFRNIAITTIQSKGKEIPDDINEYSSEKLHEWYKEMLDAIEKEKEEKKLSGIAEFNEKVNEYRKTIQKTIEDKDEPVDVIEKEEE